MKKKILVEGKITTLTILKDTVEMLKVLGKKEETYDEIIKKLIKEHNENIQVQNLSK